MPYAVVFSGGGALASWEVGCYQHLLASRNAELPACVTGASAGALNAAGICCGMSPAQLQGIWSNLRPSDVFLNNISYRSAAWALTRCAATSSIAPLVQFANETSGVLDTTPLAKTIAAIFNGYETAFLTSPTWFAISLTNLTAQSKEMFYKVPPGTALPASFQQATLPKEQPPVWTPVTSYVLLRQALMGTTALPLLFPPFGSYFDGGVLLNQPISPAIQIMDALVDPENTLTEPIDVFVLMPTPESLGVTTGLPSIANTVLTSWLSASLVSQIQTVKWRNKIRSLSGQGPIRLCVVRPSADLPATLLQFGKAVDAMVDQGRQDCTARLSWFDPANEQTWY